MRIQWQIVTNAIAATAFLVVIAAVAIWAADYLLVLGVARALESVALLPDGWIEAHRHLSKVATMVLDVPAVCWVGWWAYRRALAGERALAEDCRRR